MARMVTSAPLSVSDDTITTGMGRNVISFSRKAKPSMRGISTSSVKTSGFSALIFSRATNGSGAVPMTSIPGSADRMAVSICRIKAESSTINTRAGRLVGIFGA